MTGSNDVLSGTRSADLYGMVQVNGNSNSVTANHFSFDVPSANIVPSSANPTIVLVKSGDSNYLATNQIAANLGVEVVRDAGTTNTKVLWSANSSQLPDYTGSIGARFVPTP
jgi:inulin fructotransferase (DFA-I-forming)